MSKRRRVVPEHLDEELRLIIFQDHNYCSVVIVDGDDNVLGQGDARREPDDDVDLDIGATLATGRAFADVGRKLVRRGQGLVKHADNLREHRAVHQART